MTLRSEGSGILVRPGLILTNRHVVQNAQRLRLTFASGRWLTAGPEAVAGDDLKIGRLAHLGSARADLDRPPRRSKCPALAPDVCYRSLAHGRSRSGGGG